MTNNRHSTPNYVRRVEIIAFDRVQLLDVAGPLQVFATANDLAWRQGSPAPYVLAVVAPKTPSVETSAGLGLVVTPLPRNSTAVDTLIAAGGFGVNAASADEALLGWVRRRASQTRRLASVCSGAFLLAAAGLLAGRRVTTHWTRCGELARRHPELTVENDPIFIRDGNIWTSAGITAGIDLALALVEEDLGRDMALAIARQLVVFLKRPGGQAQFSTLLSLQQDSDHFGALHAWIGQNLGADLPVPDLAARAGMSDRTFLRRYKQATGCTPAKAIERLRVEAAQRQLCDSRVAIKRIAVRCGFGSEETMRRSFVRVAGVLPQDYRRRFSP
ncbi:GlxA family transcriptional regulator [Methylocapsa sp. S129]|uniref:GlxA family transcriptional regulator n=1 Tax=Methylocapsa sp. S129 TaxID=1641869 RepID=UPI00131B9DB3|nr:helix-turn-helix domain-containing protein [Methylocapsa sp. S129]